MYVMCKYNDCYICAIKCIDQSEVDDVIKKLNTQKYYSKWYVFEGNDYFAHEAHTAKSFLNNI